MRVPAASTGFLKPSARAAVSFIRQASSFFFLWKSFVHLKPECQRFLCSLHLPTSPKTFVSFSSRQIQRHEQLHRENESLDGNVHRCTTRLEGRELKHLIAERRYRDNRNESELVDAGRARQWCKYWTPNQIMNKSQLLGGHQCDAHNANGHEQLKYH